ncbi:hypothetical protein C8J57DRAFT_1135233 [Mycena rebaudengoi]|nr:hypothetical protein C8J57DRAFT_1135233 [Mycena rebaudengoi]
MALANTIPFEISSRIFIDCLPPRGQRHLTSTAAPLLLAQVCQRWRAVALSTPSLWNSVDLESNWSGISSREDPLRPSDEDDDHATMNCLLLDLWFSRAGEPPLSLTITCAFVLGPSARIHPSILAALAAYAPRCRRIEISMSSWDFCSSIQEIRGPFPLLQALDITINDAVPTVPLTAFHPAPNLRTLRLAGSLNPPSFGDIGSPELQSLTLTFWMNFPQCIEILQRFPHLRHLSLPSIDSAILARPSVLPISELRTLECSSHLFRVIAFPRLQSLTVPLPSDADAQRLARFLASPSCQIQELAITIEFSGISDEALYQCLSAGSTFVQLTLRFHVSRTSWRIPSLPQLRTLRIFDIRCWRAGLLLRGAFVYDFSKESLSRRDIPPG